MSDVQVNSRPEQGTALIVTLWILGLLSLVAAAFMADSRTTSKLAQNLAENARAEALADAGVYRAVAALLDPAHQPRIDGSAYRWMFGGGTIMISIQDEAGKIDLNTASDQLLEGLFVSVGSEPKAARKLVRAVRDFADADELKQSDGAEDDDYRAVELMDGAKDAPFDTVAELQQVLGMTLELYDRVAPALTVYSGSRSINPTTAPRQALLALPGARPEQIDAVIAARTASVERDRSSGDRSSSEALEGSTTAESEVFDEMSAADDEAAGVTGFGAPGGGVYSITALATTPEGGRFERLAIVRLTDDPIQPYIFHEWRRSWTGSPQGTTDNEDD